MFQRDVPEKVRAELEKFTLAIRQPLHNQPNSTLLYHSLILATLRDMLTACYPKFFLASSRELQSLLLERFLQHHPCLRPEHVQIPTEFLQFVQMQLLPITLVKIIECEWLEFSIENHSHTNSAALLVLPFDLDTFTAHYVPLEQKDLYYRVIYRDQQGDVYNLAIQPLLARLIQMYHEFPDLSSSEVIQAFCAQISVTISVKALQQAISWLIQRGIIHSFD